MVPMNKRGNLGVFDVGNFNSLSVQMTVKEKNIEELEAKNGVTEISVNHVEYKGENRHYKLIWSEFLG